MDSERTSRSGHADAASSRRAREEPSMAGTATDGFFVMVDDNFHNKDESERTCAGEFDPNREAPAVAKSSMERSLEHDGSFEGDLMVGEHPFIVPDPGLRFSARNYARRLAEETVESGVGGGA
jgi:hypothetical protein